MIPIKINDKTPCYKEAFEFYQKVWECFFARQWQGTDQLWRATTSVVANICEGFAYTRIGYSPRWLAGIAYGSLCEVGTWLEVAFNEQVITEQEFDGLALLITPLESNLKTAVNAVLVPPKSQRQEAEESRELGRRRLEEMKERR
jgi:four helix bundle protein